MGLCIWDALRGSYESVPGVHSNALEGHAISKDGTLVPTSFASSRDALENMAVLGIAAVAKSGRGRSYLYARPRSKRTARPVSTRIDGLSSHERLDLLVQYDVPEALHRFVMES